MKGGSIMRYIRHLSKKTTPQRSPIPGDAQVANSAGGYVYELDKWARLRRFLILGSEGNTYYATEHEMTRENANAVVECIREDGLRAVSEIAEISDSGRAPKNDPAVFALALCLSEGSDETKRLACEALPRVCRIGTHLFHFADAANELRGWGKMLRGAVAGWYAGKSARELALQVVKYRQRDGWSHRDLLRLAHVTPGDEMASGIFCYAVNSRSDVDAFKDTDARIIWATEEVKSADKARAIELIREFDLPREVVPTALLKDPDVWDSMLPSMGLTAMIRNLANMTRRGLVGPGRSEAVDLIVSRLGDAEQLRRSRVHPIQVLSALVTYNSGRGARSQGTGWTPNQSVVDALDAAFYTAFANVEPTGKRTMLALDVSGSMGAGVIAGIPGLSPRIASAAMAMVTLAVEDDVQTVAFSSGKGFFSSPNGNQYRDYRNGLIPISLSKRKRLDDVVSAVSSLPFGGTDCSLPMLYAMERKIAVDVFVVYTDSETWAGTIHPVQALRQYRERFNPEAKLVVIGMVANQFTIADPNDAGMLDVVGFDASAPALMADFARGAL